jgi:tRNA-2-methylthio-N6-dimethylallyladenosine synthase
MIVGFPGERPEDFRDTISLLEEVQFDYSYSFKYSVRPGTAAASLVDDVPEEEKGRRLAELQSAQDRLTRARLATRVGQTLPVLVEGWSRRGPPQLSGRTPWNQVVNFEGRHEVPPGTIAQVCITEAGSHSLRGRLEGGEAEASRC